MSVTLDSMLTVAVAVAAVVTLTASGAAALSDMSDLPGPYCETRKGQQCCDSRQDNCAVPLLGTLCYCDQFCDRPYNDDCCPDYAFVCLNMTRPTPPPQEYQDPPCLYNGEEYPEGARTRINCNECKCKQVCTDTKCHMDLVCSQEQCLVDPLLITRINQDPTAGWMAANYTEFWGHTLTEGYSRRLGTRHSRKRAYTMRHVNPYFDRERVKNNLWYDLRMEKRGMISAPLDQGWCAVDWVISTVQVATDRLALVSRGEDRAALSPQHLLSCNSKNQRGCDGGHLTRAWKFIQKFGLVPNECYPWVGRQTNCSVTKSRDKTRTTARCVSGNAFMPLHRTGPAYRISREPEAIMYEILTSGPVQATMKVTQDFFSYRSGVYQCSGRSGRSDTYHSVRIVGWGEEVQHRDLVKYWIVSNSWGTWWGENGYFKIVRGVNECEIESLVLAAWINPIVPRKDPSMPMMEDNIISNTLS